MKPSEALSQHRDAVMAIVLRSGLHNVRVFGSTLHGNDTEGSDLDLLIDAPRGTTLLDMVRLQHAIESQLGISVDILTADDLPPAFRGRVIGEARPL